MIEAVLMAVAEDRSERISATLDAGLSLMGELAERSEWQLYEAPAGEFAKPRIPDTPRLIELSRRCQFDADQLEGLCGGDWAESLAPLILTEPAQPNGNDLEARPLVPMRSGGLIVARPDVIAPALAFALSTIAAKEEFGAELEESFSLLAARRALSSLAEMGVRHTRPAPDIGGAFPHAAALLPLDADVGLHLLVLSADVEAGGGHTSQLWLPPEGPLLSAHLDAVEALVREQEPWFRQIVHVIVLEGGGAQPVLRMEREPDLRSPVLVFTGSELEWLGRHPDVSSRDLLAFAHDATDLRGRVRVASFSQFDELTAWRSEDAGFASLEATAVESFDQVILSAGFGVDLRMEVAERYSPRVAPAPEGEGWWRVARHLEYQDVDVWRPWGGTDWPPHMFVPEIGAGVWVLSPEDAGGERWDSRRKWTELIAYWLWRLRDQLPNLRAAAASRSAPLIVRVDVDIDELIPREAEASGDTDAITLSVDDGTVRLQVGPGAPDLLGGPDATPEQELVSRVLQLLCEVAGAADADRPTFPPGLRKLIYTSSPDPALRRVRAPEELVHPSYRTRAHRRAGSTVAENLSLRPGQVEGDRLNAVLHAGVDVLFADLEQRLQPLDRERTVPMLVAAYERLLHSSAIADAELISIEEFFGHHAEAAAERHDRWKAVMSASVACRFAIEVAAASPPRGANPPSDNQLQELLANSLAIADFGSTSDLVNFGLTKEAEAVLVPPGLLMAHAADVLRAHDAFSTALYEGDVGRSETRRSQAVGITAPRMMDEDVEAQIEAAHRADHGYTLADIVSVLSRLIEQPEHELGFTEISRSDALQLSRDALAQPDGADALLAALTLRPRKEFLEPPPPFKTSDVYPWRHNRPLSYIRRPLIAIPTPRGEERLVYGRGACFAAIQFLLRLASTGRLGAEGSALRGASIELQRREARELEDTIAQRLEVTGEWVCRRRVKRLPGVEIERRRGEDLGDIDVLAANPAEKALACLEVKSLAGALAPHQLRNELDATFAPRGRKRSAAVKFVERVNVVRANVPAALDLLGLTDDSADWRVGMSMLTDPEVLSPLLDECPAPVISVEQFRAAVSAGSLSKNLEFPDSALASP
jgi:hypothetical protein